MNSKSMYNLNEHLNSFDKLWIVFNINNILYYKMYQPIKTPRNEGSLKLRLKIDFYSLKKIKSNLTIFLQDRPLLELRLNHNF